MRKKTVGALCKMKDRCMHMRRTLCAQSFVWDAEADMQRHEGKAAAALSALDTRPRRQLTPAAAQAFYDRLLEDSEHRIRNRCLLEHHTCSSLQ